MRRHKNYAMNTLNKILIANRGEIAVRVIRTARKLGFRTVAVYSEADADSPHVRAADQAICIGAPDAGESYLAPEKILAAAAASAADAIHPGYGFLSENAGFARACADKNITFIGPGAEAIELMGNKRLAKIAMLKAGVPCIPGYQGAGQDDDTLIARALELGFPLMVKASAGGGGRGMRLVSEARELSEQIHSARSEASNAFGNGELILERAMNDPRHIEIQVFADTHGNVVYLGERDCSIQRRHQKVLEEAPSPFVDPELRRRMGEAAVAATKACHYCGAGTVEFLVDSEKNFYFLEMNTRLQVEHPVTELITGLDLVEWQLQVAAGEALPLTQDQVTLTGHAVEARLYAEDPRNNFLPQTGCIMVWDFPRRAGVRVDHGIRVGQNISRHYDPLLAKIIGFGPDRKTAIRRLASAVQDTRLLGLNNNRLFLQNILCHPVFTAGRATTAFIGQHFSQDASLDQTHPLAITQAKAALLFFQRRNKRREPDFNWRNAAPRAYNFKFDCEGQIYQVGVEDHGDRYNMTVGDANIELELIGASGNECVLIDQGIRETLCYAFDNNTLYLDAGYGHYVFNDITQQPAAAAAGPGGGQIKAPMAGAVLEVLVRKGDTVAQGQTLVVLEAMKMELQLKADTGGSIENVNVKAGDQVKNRQLLVTIGILE